MAAVELLDPLESILRSLLRELVLVDGGGGGGGGGGGAEPVGSGDLDAASRLAQLNENI